MTIDGGSAFPRPYSDEGDLGERQWAQGGMSLRDYFAGQALIGAMMSASNLGVAHPDDRAKILKQTAVLLYEVADAMIAARER